MRCEEAREAIPAFVGEREVSLSFRRHLSSCPLCRVEVARYEAVMGGLRGLEGVVVPPPPTLVQSLKAIPATLGRIDHARIHVLRNRKAYLGGAAAAVALAGAGAAIWRTRTRTAAIA